LKQACPKCRYAREEGDRGPKGKEITKIIIINIEEFLLLPIDARCMQCVIVCQTIQSLMQQKITLSRV
jgi:hypothetical protein